VHVRETALLLVGASLMLVGPLPLFGALLTVAVAVGWAIRWEAAGEESTMIPATVPVEVDDPHPHP
jgi:hypothetical protein